MAAKYPDTASRLAFVMETCGYPKDAAFADALALRPQNLRNWRDRGKIGRASLERIRHVTGASIDWMITGSGEPFPDGPIRYEGALGPSSGLADRVSKLEAELDTLAAVTAHLVGFIRETAPNALEPLSAQVHRALADSPNPPAFLELLAQTLPPAPTGAGARPARKR